MDIFFFKLNWHFLQKHFTWLFRRKFKTISNNSFLTSKKVRRKWKICSMKQSFFHDLLPQLFFSWICKFTFYNMFYLINIRNKFFTLSQNSIFPYCWNKRKNSILRHDPWVKFTCERNFMTNWRNRIYKMWFRFIKYDGYKWRASLVFIVFYFLINIHWYPYSQCIDISMSLLHCSRFRHDFYIWK